MSDTIQNEILEILAHAVLSEIVSEARESTYFVKLLMFQTKPFLLLLLYIKSFPLMIPQEAFIMKNI